MWRACKNLLLTKENLKRRKVVDDPKCPICSLEVETTYHILWGYPSTQDVCGASKRIFHKCVSHGPDFFHIAKVLFNKCGNDEFSCFVETARKIWFCRNSMIHEVRFAIQM